MSEAITGVKVTAVTVVWHCKCGLSWRFTGTEDGYVVLYKAIQEHLKQGPPHKLLMHPSQKSSRG